MPQEVRSQYYYEGWRILNGEHHPFTGNGLHGFDTDRIAAENITKVAFYCWTQPWQSEPAAQWFDAQFPHVDVYDLKGLSYLDDIPGFCKFIDGQQHMIQQMAPHCSMDEVASHECAADTPEAIENARRPADTPDYTESVDQPPAEGLVPEEVAAGEAAFLRERGQLAPSPSPSDKDALERQFASQQSASTATEESPWPLVLCAAAVLVAAAFAAVARSRAAPAPDAKAETAVDAEAGGKDKEVEVEVVASPLGNVA